LLAIAGCSQETLAPSITDSLSQSPLLPTATPELPESPTVSPLDLTPPPDLGIVVGALSLEGQPAPGHTMYLAAVISSGEGMEMAALDPANDPRAESDGAGYFVFLDVPPGRYGLGISSPVGPLLIRGADGDEIIAEVLAGQVTDLGTVRIVPFGE
jgi:hypothetical protein